MSDQEEILGAEAVQPLGQAARLIKVGLTVGQRVDFRKRVPVCPPKAWSRTVKNNSQAHVYSGPGTVTFLTLGFCSYTQQQHFYYAERHAYGPARRLLG